MNDKQCGVVIEWGVFCGDAYDRPKGRLKIMPNLYHRSAALIIGRTLVLKPFELRWLAKTLVQLADELDGEK